MSRDLSSKRGEALMHITVPILKPFSGRFSTGSVHIQELLQEPLVFHDTLGRYTSITLEKENFNWKQSCNITYWRSWNIFWGFNLTHRI